MREHHFSAEALLPAAVSTAFRRKNAGKIRQGRYGMNGDGRNDFNANCLGVKRNDRARLLKTYSNRTEFERQLLFNPLS